MSTRIQSDNHISLIKAGILGATSGYAIKYLWPLIDSETPSNAQKKEFLNKAYSERISTARKFVDTKLKIVNAAYADEFLKTFEKKQAKTQYEKKLKTYIPKEVQQLFNDAYAITIKAGKKAYKKAEISFALKTKQQRPSGYFLGVGAALFIAGAFVVNVIKDMTN